MTGLSFFLIRCSRTLYGIWIRYHTCVLLIFSCLSGRCENRAKPSRLRNLLNFKPINPCTQGNLTFFTVWFNGFGSGSGPEFEPFKHNWAFEHIGSVPDPWHFGTDPNADAHPRNLSYDQQIRLWIRFWMGIQLQILLFSSVTFKQGCESRRQTITSLSIPRFR